ncbi:transcriptional regulator, LacI family [Candidatus Moduliflexus flocculans]|uniref:Transcriptional regulator, LacI family n=1 Tax=Candidatus Moduliflexus flocculans TaxID=1499966 RepID=A0A081BQ59_9BACT|nr:transcriptional regulator, LacI family [Candidatus Moduliflexus flocculans]
MAIRPEKKQHPAQKKAVTRQDVAELADVSSAVVSYVINNGPRPVAEETKKRVLKAIEKLGYRPNKHAQRLKSRSAKGKRQLGIIMGGNGEILLRPYYADVLFGIYDEAYRQGYHIRFLHFFEELHDPTLFNEYIHPDEISALILFPIQKSLLDSHDQTLLQRILKRIDNIVCLELPIASLPSVIFDRAEAARVAVTHLIHSGHQRIAYVGEIDERLDGYRQALLEHGLPYDERLIKSSGKHDNAPDEGYEGARQLVELESRPTAVFAVCDEIALGVLGALHDCGIRVPDDIALTSIDDLEFAAIVRPALTTVHVPRRQIGIQALRLVAMHADYPDPPAVSMLLPTELIVRESCGAKKA